MKNKPLIIGESGERPWFDGAEAKCLWNWFDVRDYTDLVEHFHVVSVVPKKGSKLIPPGHLQHVNRLIADTELVFLVGKFAQMTFFTGIKPTPDDVVWKGFHNGRVYVGLPHPSGLNRQLNSVDDSYIKHNVSFILDVWRTECSRESLQS